MNNRAYYAAFARTREELLLLQRVCYLLCTSLIVTAFTASLSRDFSPGLGLPLFLGMLVCIFALSAAARVPVLNLVLFYTFSVLEGLMAGPMLAMIARYVPNGSQMISLAFCLTAATVGGVGTYVWTTARDYSHWGRMLSIGLWVAIGIGLLAWFVPGMHSARSSCSTRSGSSSCSPAFCSTTSQRSGCTMAWTTTSSRASGFTWTS